MCSFLTAFFIFYWKKNFTEKKMLIEYISLGGGFHQRLGIALVITDEPVCTLMLFIVIK
jgi:hypothetical protein